MTKYKIALVCITLNPPYWEFIKPMIESARKHLLANHEVDYILWSDMPTDLIPDVKVIPTEPVEWPMPTLMRYHLFLQQEELLRNYDYIFYCDADMIYVDTVGDEILGEGITAVAHPMYWFRKGLKFPLKPNPLSQAYIHVPEHYYAGGFQGGKTELFISAMKEMKKMIDKDFTINYIPIWNDESVWNKYIFNHPEIPLIFLDPSYVYPDSLIKEYYEKIWGRSFSPKLVTITKKFTTSKEAGTIIREQLSNF